MLARRASLSCCSPGGDRAAASRRATSCFNVGWRSSSRRPATASRPPAGAAAGLRERTRLCSTAPPGGRASRRSSRSPRSGCSPGQIVLWTLVATVAAMWLAGRAHRVAAALHSSVSRCPFAVRGRDPREARAQATALRGPASRQPPGARVARCGRGTASSAPSRSSSTTRRSRRVREFQRVIADEQLGSAARGRARQLVVHAWTTATRAGRAGRGAPARDGRQHRRGARPRRRKRFASAGRAPPPRANAHRPGPARTLGRVAPAGGPAARDHLLNPDYMAAALRRAARATAARVAAPMVIADLVIKKIVDIKV